MSGIYEIESLIKFPASLDTKDDGFSTLTLCQFYYNFGNIIFVRWLEQCVRTFLCIYRCSL